MIKFEKDEIRLREFRLEISFDFLVLVNVLFNLLVEGFILKGECLNANDAA